MTTVMVLAEAACLIDRQLGPAAEAALYSSVIDGDLEVAGLGWEGWERVRELVAGYADLRLGGTDASVPAGASGTATTTTGYTPAYAPGTETDLPSAIKVTSPAPYSWQTTTTLDQGRELPLTVTEPNLEVRWRRAITPPRARTG